VVVSVPSHPKYLCVVREVTARIGLMHDLGEEVVEEIKLAVDEACSNVIKYAYRGNADKRIVVRYKVDRGQFEVVIEDSGIKADPGVIRGRKLEEVRPGGLGVHLIKRCFDVFEFDEKKKNGNRLRLVRYLKERNEDRDNGT
jgi:anti-sigma regulatory factor (Ser/Thr protein kinase)